MSVVTRGGEPRVQFTLAITGDEPSLFIFGVFVNLLIIAIVISILPACFAITAAHRSGARGWWAYLVWGIEELADRLWRVARWMRDFHAWRMTRREQVVR